MVVTIQFTLNVFYITTSYISFILKLPPYSADRKVAAYTAASVAMFDRRVSIIVTLEAWHYM